MALFFYDGGIAQGVAFDGLLRDGNKFADKFLSAFDDDDEPQLVHIATDGETYGHHHRHGEMALASCLNKIDEGDVAYITNYGEYLEKFPPTWEIEIHDNSSWSCVHGIERWRSDCGCSSGCICIPAVVGFLMKYLVLRQIKSCNMRCVRCSILDIFQRTM